MTPSDNSFLSMRGSVASLTDGVVTHDFDLVAIGPGVGPGLACATVISPSGAWDITHEISTGKVIDIADAAMPDVTQSMPAGTEEMQ